MKASTMAAAATVLVGILAAGTPVRADEDCDNVVKALEDAQLVATKTVDQTMDDIKKATGQPADDKKKASVKNTFCSVSGEYLGTTRAFRAVAAECLTGNKRRARRSPRSTSRSRKWKPRSRAPASDGGSGGRSRAMCRSCAPSHGDCRRNRIMGLSGA